MTVSILSEKQKERIVYLHLTQGLSKVELGRRFGVSARTIGRVITAHGAKSNTATTVKDKTDSPSTPATLITWAPKPRDYSIPYYRPTIPVDAETVINVYNAHTKQLENKGVKAKEIWWGDSFYYEIVEGAPETTVESFEGLVCQGDEEPALDYSKTVVICTPQQVMITLENGEQFVVQRSKEHFQKIFILAMEEKYEEMMELVNLTKVVNEFVFGTDIVVKEGQLYYLGEEIHNSIAQRIVNECFEGGKPERYVEFFKKLYKNPSYKAIEHCYDFMLHNDLDILENGDIRAFKGIFKSGDGKPVSSRGDVQNWKGWTVEMPRNMVEDNPHITCSYGLHVAAKQYASNFGQTLVEVAVSPEHIVSVPIDYDNQKCRACKYTVLTGDSHPEGVVAHIVVDKNGKVLSRNEA